MYALRACIPTNMTDISAILLTIYIESNSMSIIHSFLVSLQSNASSKTLLFLLMSFYASLDELVLLALSIVLLLTLLS